MREEIPSFPPQETAGTQESEKRYRFFRARRQTPDGPPLPDEAKLSELRAKIAAFECYRPASEEEQPKTPEDIERIKGIERRIIAFAHGLGVELTEDSFPPLDKIYFVNDAYAHLRPERCGLDRERQKNASLQMESAGYGEAGEETAYLLDDDTGTEDAAAASAEARGFSCQNEIAFRTQTSDDMTGYLLSCGMGREEIKVLEDRLGETVLSHELIHSACRLKAYLGNSKGPSDYADGVKTFGNHSREDSAQQAAPFDLIDEALTEFTNHEIFFQAPDKRDYPMAYADQVILLCALAEDMADRIRRQPDLVRSRHFSVRPLTNISAKDIIEHLQRGMFENDRRYLSLIKDVYGKENFQLLSRLELDNAAEIAETLGLTDAARIIYDNQLGDRSEITLKDLDFRHTLNA